MSAGLATIACPCCGAALTVTADRGEQSIVSAPILGAASTLTLKEMQVLRLLAGGHSNKAAARTLGISSRTVETHRLSLRRKTGAGGLRDLVVLAHQLGLSVGSEARA